MATEKADFELEKIIFKGEVLKEKDEAAFKIQSEYKKLNELKEKIAADRKEIEKIKV